MARAALAPLITRLRSLLNDPPLGGAPVWRDDDLEAALDAQRLDVVSLALTTTDTAVTFYAGTTRAWASDTVIADSVGTAKTPEASDVLNGVWTFATVQPALYATGQTFDLWAAAADICEMWAMQAALQVDVSDGGDSVRLSQRHAQLLKQAEIYRRKSDESGAAANLPSASGGFGTLTMYRSDC